MTKEEHLLLILKYGKPPPPATEKEEVGNLWKYLDNIKDRSIYFESLPKSFQLQHEVFTGGVMLNIKYALMPTSKVLQLLSEFNKQLHD